MEEILCAYEDLLRVYNLLKLDHGIVCQDHHCLVQYALPQLNCTYMQHSDVWIANIHGFVLQLINFHLMLYHNWISTHAQFEHCYFCCRGIYVYEEHKPKSMESWNSDVQPLDVLRNICSLQLTTIMPNTESLTLSKTAHIKQQLQTFTSSEE